MCGFFNVAVNKLMFCTFILLAATVGHCY